MRKKRLVVFSAKGNESFSQEQQHKLDSFYEVNYVTALQQVPRANFRDLIRNADVVALSPRAYPNFTDDECKEVFGGIELVALPTTGFEWIDISSIKNHGVKITNIPDFSSDSCAEFTFGLILNTVRGIEKSIRNQRSYIGRELNGKTLGVFGLGNVGRRVAKIASAFNMKVIGFDIDSNQYVDLDMVSCDLNFLLEKSDIITVHIPLNRETFNYFDDSLLSKVKRGSLLVNTSRPDLVHAQSCLNALESGIISHYAFDIGYKKINDYKLFHDREDVSILPHMSWYTQEAVEREIELWVSGLVDYANGVTTNAV